MGSLYFNHEQDVDYKTTYKPGSIGVMGWLQSCRQKRRQLTSTD